MEDSPRLRLPDDVLADILARLAPRSLAVSRCICREWRDVVDGRHLLRPDLLPLTVGGIFVESYGTDTPDFFARPSMAGRVAGRLESFVPREGFGADYIEITDCCNGLLLLEGEHEVVVVVNPATRRSARLPRCDGLPEGDETVSRPYWSHLAFDPTVSPHYEVLSMLHPFNGGKVKRLLLERLRWPPSVYVMHVYSSRTGRWEERHFALNDDSDHEGLRRSTTDGVSAYGYAAHWRGVLYVHCNNHFILRINLSHDEYQVIDLPVDACASDDYEGYLGKSKNGIYFAAIISDTCRVLVWFLNESNGKIEWVFKHGISRHDLITSSRENSDTQTDRFWILENDDSCQEFKPGPTVDVEKNLDGDFDDNESAMKLKDYCNTKDTHEFMILGFHPNKEIVFLHTSRVMAYYFSMPKVQDLGEILFKHPDHMRCATFIYTPCWVGDLSENS